MLHILVFIAVAEKEAPLLAERANSSFLLLWRWHLASAPAQQFCACASLRGHRHFNHHASGNAPPNHLGWPAREKNWSNPFSLVQDLYW